MKDRKALKRRPWLAAGSLAALAMAAVGAVAQETPKEDPQTEPEKDEQAAPVKHNEITFGYSNFRGNPDINYYARPAEGFTLQSLRLLNPLGDKSPFAFFHLNGFPDNDSVAEGQIAFNLGRTVLRGVREHYGFYKADWRPRSMSTDDQTVLTLDHTFGNGIGGFVLYKANERDARFGAPRDPDHTRERLAGAGIGGNVAGGNLGLTVSDRTIADDTGVQPKSLQREFGASYTRDFGDSLTLEGAAAYTKIEQAGWDSSGVHTYRFGGSLDLGPATGLQFQFSRQDLDLDTVQNAYARKRLVSGGRLYHRFGGWSLQAGYKRKETERVRNDHTYVDVPKVDMWDARLAGKIGAARLSLKGSWEDLREAAVMNTLDNRQLQWDDRAMLQAKVDTGGELFSAYGTYTYRFQQNKARGVDVNWNNLTLGGSYVFSPDLNGFAEFSSDDFRVGGEAESGQALDFYYPNSRTVACGLNWSKDPSTSASASLNYYESGDVRGTQLTMSLRRRIGLDNDLELVVAPWRHEDKLYDLTGYRTTIVMVRYSVKF